MSHGHGGPVKLAMDGRGRLHLAGAAPFSLRCALEEAIMQPMAQQCEQAWLLHRIAGSVDRTLGRPRFGGGRSLTKRARFRESRGAKPDVATRRERCDVRLNAASLK